MKYCYLILYYELTKFKHDLEKFPDLKQEFPDNSRFFQVSKHPVQVFSNALPDPKILCLLFLKM